MQTPTIGKKQVKKTLSGRKKKGEAIKNVLAKPYENYWPLLSPKDNDCLKATLCRLLPRLKNNKVNIPYSVIKVVPKSERALYRSNYLKQPLWKPPTQDLIIGVNDVSRLLESHQAGCVLVASDVQPRLLVQHIIDQAVVYTIPIVVMIDLRNTLKNNCGISGCTVAIRNTADPDSNLGVIRRMVLDMWKKHPVPLGHISTHRKLDVSTITVSDSDDEVHSVKDWDNLICVKTYHLKRVMKNERAFVPETSGGVAPENFISLNTSSSIGVDNSNDATLNYRPLSVKRIKGDHNRNQRKIAKFKNKVTTLK